MKVWKVIIFVLLMILPGSGMLTAQPVRVMTFNIRLDVASDGVNAWNNRKDYVVSMMRFHKADVIGLQEAQRHQLDYLLQAMPEYGYIGVGRDDGKNAGEFSAVLFRKQRFDTAATKTFWCSETPEKPGKGWDAAYQRVCTYAKLQDKRTGKSFYFFNTHLDNEGKTARLEGAKLIKKTMHQVCGTVPAVLTGDFNSYPDSEPYQAIVSKEAGKGGYLLSDSKQASATVHHGADGTFTGFDLQAKPLQPIDFIFVTKTVKVKSHGTLTDSFNGLLPSDHYPVLAELEF